MKSPYQILGLIILAGGIFSETCSQQQRTSEGENFVSEISLQQESITASSDWSTHTTRTERRPEYFIKPFGQTTTYAAANSRQQLGFMFTPHGYAVKNFTYYNEKPWRAHFRFKGISRSGKELRSPALVALTNQENLLEYDYADFTIQYVNDKRGMRQNFIIKNQLPESGNIEVAIQLTGDLRPKMKNSGKLIMYDGKYAQLYYDDIVVWDANDQPLHAWMELRGTSELVISINDEFASYPITIDPLNHSPGINDYEFTEQDESVADVNDSRIENTNLSEIVIPEKSNFYFSCFAVEDIQYDEPRITRAGQFSVPPCCGLLSDSKLERLYTLENLRFSSLAKNKKHFPRKKIA